MKPNIDFHHITRVELSPIDTFEATAERHAFATRDLILTDAGGERFTVGLFADTAEALRCTGDVDIPVPAPTT